MTQLRSSKTVYPVSQFLDWQRSGTLQLKPVFQRRSTWNDKAKSLLIDTIYRGLPIPLVFLRQIQDLDTYKTTLEVVDGQQRLRTLLAFIDPGSLPDLQDTDRFTVKRAHNAALADQPFEDLPKDVRGEILQYEISTHVLPPTTGDDVVLLIFSRLNSTGLDLSRQELRNARYFGVMKSLVYDLASRNVEYWRDWRVFTDDNIARMEEAEAVSEYLLAMMFGVGSTSQTRLDSAYAEYDDALPGDEELARRFDATMAAIDEAVGSVLAATRIRRKPLFYSLFGAIYDHMYGFGSEETDRPARRLPSGIRGALESLNERVAAGALSADAQDAMDKGTSDTARRRVRHALFLNELGLKPFS